MSKSLNDGAVQVPFFSKWDNSAYRSSGFFDNDKMLSKFTQKEMDLLLHGKDLKFKLPIGESTMNASYQGIMEKINKSYIQRDIKTLSARTRKNVEPYLTMMTCLLCNGARLSQAALNCKVKGYHIAQLSDMQVDELIRVLQTINIPEAAPLIQALSERLQQLVNIGLEYLSLSRETDTLSGGESQRVKIVKHLTSGLVDAIYIFDEPSVGLHPRDVHRMNELLQSLRDKGNTVLVVEHDPAVMTVADNIVDMGPRAGTQGGRIVYEGTYLGLTKAKTLTAQFLNRNIAIKSAFRKPTGKLSVREANINNLKNVSVEIPRGVLTVVTGVAGSGKSSLINEAFLQQHPDAVVIDQSPIGVSSRSNPATYTGIMDEVRKAFASANKVDAGRFSFNSKGACDNCQGLGVTYTDLAFLEGVALPCEICQGKRFKKEVLKYEYQGKSIADILELTVRDALEFFKIPGVATKLQALSDVGVDYLTLGQPLSTLSGGECQRIKLASELHKQGSIYVLDEPTTGLHMSDITHLVEIMNRLVEGGNTVIVIEHNLDVISSADWIIDMGPEGGNKGGQIVFEGTPNALLGAKQSLTSKYLKQ